MYNIYIYQETVDLPRPPSVQVPKNMNPSGLSPFAPVATAQQSQHSSARCLELWVVAMKRNGLDGGVFIGSLVTSTPHTPHLHGHHPVMNVFGRLHYDGYNHGEI